jgi:alpha,alpha-trehalase
LFDWFITQISSKASRLRNFGRNPANDDHAPLRNPVLVQEAQSFVRQSWDGLRRDSCDLLAMLEDSDKMPKQTGQPYSVFISAKQDPVEAWQHLTQGIDDASDLQRIQLYQLDALEPDNLEKAVAIRSDGQLLYEETHRTPPHGFLYLPHPYLVPGGRFNEMYGADSYNILLGLLQDGRLEDALNILENMLYEVEHYGMVLNANRTYQMGRSHPPLLSRMVLAFCDALDTGMHDLSGIEKRLEGNSGKEMAEHYLLRALAPLRRQHEYWIQPMFKAGDTGLARYMDANGTPTAEVEHAEPIHWQKARDEVRELYMQDPERWVVFYDAEADLLTPDFYRGDRAMRASMYDPSGRYDALSADIIHHASVGLNSLLYRMEMDMAEIFDRLKGATSVQRSEMRSSGLCFRESGEARAAQMREWLWHPEHGFVDYRFASDEQVDYPFVTGFYPMWAGLATADEARLIVEHLLPKLEMDYGLAVSDRECGGQWGAPYMWMPKVEMVVEALTRYGYHEDAYRVMEKSLSTVLHNFEEHGTFFEKYNARDGGVSVDTTMGYNVNVHDAYGFGWSNAVFGRLMERYVEMGQELGLASSGRETGAKLAIS